ncbi:MAG: hypothetical protein ACLQBB_00635 [Solirubrobacteraceae bacterium]
MSVKLSKSAYEHAQQLILAGDAVRDDRDEWSKHQPSAEAENKFIEEHGYDQYALWHLGVDDEKPEKTKERYEFPYGDLHVVRRSAVLAAESRAGQYHHQDIELAAAHLHGMLET